MAAIRRPPSPPPSIVIVQYVNGHRFLLFRLRLARPQFEQFSDQFVPQLVPCRALERTTVINHLSIAIRHSCEVNRHVSRLMRFDSRYLISKSLT